MKKRLIIFFMVFSIIITNFIFAENKLNSQEEVAPGVVNFQYTVKTSKGNAILNVLKCDLNNPYIKLNTVAGNGSYTEKASVSQMANRTNAVGLCNGDFFSMALQGVPLGPSIIDGDIKSSPGVLTDIYSFGIDSTNTAYILDTNFGGKVTAPNGTTYNIDGLNKNLYWYQPSKEYSHESKIQMYTDFWTSKSRGDKTAGEVLLNQDNVVEKIIYDKNLDLKIPSGYKILQVSGASATFVKNNIKIGDKLKITYDIYPQKSWKMLIGGHSLLVDNSKTRPYKKDINSIGGTRARTCIGIADGGKSVYIVSCEGRTKRSSGMSLNELSNFMVNLGCQRALNLDGGGSTAMVVRNLGDLNRTRVINPEGNKAERKVVNGIGVFNTTKNTGQIIDGKLKGNTDLVIGQSTDFSLKSAWDKFLNPIDISDRTYKLSENSNGQNILNGTSYLAMVPGKFNLSLTTNKGENISKEINIKDSKAFESLEIISDSRNVKPGDKINFTIEAKVDGKDIKLSPRVFKFQLLDVDGKLDVNSSTVTINKLGTNPKLIASINDKKAELNFLDANAKTVTMNIGKKTYKINGQKAQMDTAPFIKNSRTMVPLRFIVEALGYQVDWNGEEKSVFVRTNDINNDIYFKVDSKKINVGEKSITVDTPAIIKGDRTFVPIRFVAEILGMEVSYNANDKEIVLVDKNPKKTNENSITKANNNSLINNNKVDNNVNNNINRNSNAKNTNSQTNSNHYNITESDLNQLDKDSGELESIILDKNKAK